MTTEKQDPLAELMQLADMHAYAKVTASFPREKLPRNQLFALAQPLTDKAIADLMPTNTSMSRREQLDWIARAVERHHGIQGASHD